MKKVLKKLLWVLIAAVFIGTFVFLYMNSKGKKTEFELVSPQSGSTLSKSSLLTGAIEPRDEIEIKPQISGIISEILVEAGQQVHVGDIIAKIKVIPDESQLSSAQFRVEEAERQLELAQSKHERTAELYKKKYVSREEFEESETSLANAKINLDSARDALSIVRDGVSAKNAQESNTLVRATITGLVLDVPVKVGTSVIQSNTFNDGTTIAKVADMNDLIFKGKVDETEVGQLYVGQPMQITIGALQDLTSDATIEYIAPKANSENGTNTFEIKAAVTIPGDRALRAGYSANAAVTLASVENVLTVPESVIEFDGDDAYVYVLTGTEKEQKFERRQIETGLSDGITIEVKSGLTADAKLRGMEKK
ncbi:MAG: efflux RND transporter periplasmic adaptor subunit [Muribaculaceae bacterium]|nr:efflux RND transporter periplasmic adaptor subunit [Muribaculaceae bacterium]